VWWSFDPPPLVVEVFEGEWFGAELVGERDAVEGERLEIDVHHVFRTVAVRRRLDHEVSHCDGPFVGVV
jgi:hypothetical protein